MDRAVNWPQLHRCRFLHRLYFVPRSFPGCFKLNEFLEMRVRRVRESRIHTSDRKLSYAAFRYLRFACRTFTE